MSELSNKERVLKIAAALDELNAKVVYVGGSVVRTAKALVMTHLKVLQFADSCLMMKLLISCPRLTLE